MASTVKAVVISDGLRKVLQTYCSYRNWQSVSPETAEGIRTLITRAGTTEETLKGLRFFFESRYVDDWVKENRPNLGLPFLTQAWDRFEIHQAESKPFRDPIFSHFNEYSLMRAANG